MRRTWNLSYLVGHYARWLFALCVMLPAGAVVAVLLAFVWLLWMATAGLQAGLMWLQSVSFRDMPAPASGDSVRGISTAGVKRAGASTLSLELPRRRTDPAPAERLKPYRQTTVDLQRSLDGMARYGWPKEKVMTALKAAGAGWVWTEKDASGERVHAHYREGRTLFDRYKRPAAHIHLTFDAAGRLERAGVHRAIVKM